MPLQLKRLFSSRTAKVVTLLVAALLSVGIWVLVNRIANPAPQSDVLMKLTHSGGLCGEDKPCTPVSERIFTDGRFEGSEPLSSDELADLKNIINRTDFMSYQPNPSPTCSSYTDGHDLSLSFPGKTSSKQFTLCLLDIPEDDTGLRAIVSLLDSHHN